MMSNKGLLVIAAIVAGFIGLILLPITLVLLYVYRRQVVDFLKSEFNFGGLSAV